MRDESSYTHTVHCYDNKSLRQHFVSLGKATQYANSLLANGHKVKIFPYTPSRRYIDIVAERGPDFYVKG